MKFLDPNNPLDLIPATLMTNPDAVVIVPVFAPAIPDATLVLRAQKKLRRLPPDLAARIAREQAAVTGNGDGHGAEVPTHIEVGRVLLTIPVDMAENLRAPVAERHPLYLFSVHRSVYDEAMRQARSGIVLAGPNTPIPPPPKPSSGGSGSGGGIIKP